MAKNEYGIPDAIPVCSCGGDRDPMDEGGSVGGVTDQGDGCVCGGNTAVDSLPPAYVYAPSQKFCMLYSDTDALSKGTLFEQLYKPMEVYGRERIEKR